MDIIIKKYQINNININVIRDDLLPFGTKQRALIEYLSNQHYQEYIYVSPPNGMGQLALAQCSKIIGKKTTIFTPFQKNKHKITKTISKLSNVSLKEINVTKFSDLYQYATEYLKKIQEQKGNDYIFMFDLGFFDKEFIDIMAKNIKSNWKNSFNIKRMWITGGSGTVLNALYKVFPKTHFILVQVGHVIDKKYIKPKRTTVLTPPQKFKTEATILPPYPSSRTYDAKIWQFIHKMGEDNDFIWNVATEIKDFPFYKQITNIKEIMEMFSKLKKYDYRSRIIHKPYQIKNISKNIDLKYQDKYTIILSKDSDYQDWNQISSYFTEESRMRCNVINSLSPYDFFYKNKDLVYEHAYNKYGKVGVFELREALYDLNKQCTSFRPSLMKTMIDMFQSKSVLDFSSGWGDRLIGAIASNCNYVGIDPNKHLINGYREMIKVLGNSNFNKFHMISGKAESVSIPKKSYDLVFTSPPYFDLETYSNDKSQSISHFKNEKIWYQDFLLFVLKKVWKLLETNGIMAININQKKKENYIQWMIKDVSKFTNSEYLGVISYADKNLSNPQPIWIWKKISVL
jgi:16S rRNA G966 N2-methylase RsmD